MFLRELQDGAEIELALLVRSAEVRSTRGGGEYLRLQLGDKTGAVAAVMWEGAAGVVKCCQAGCVVFVQGRYNIHPRYGPQLTLRAARTAAEDEYALENLLDGSTRPFAQMEEDLRALIATVQKPHLAELLQRIFGPEAETWERFREAPAAKYYHQAYRHGLLEHCLTVAQAVSSISATFPGIDRDVAVTGGLLHDIGKLDAYTADPMAIDLTDAGRLQGEIPLGYYRVRREIEAIGGFPPALGQAVLHIILSHHGTHEHGSPVLPCTREATLVHMADNLGGKLGSFDRIEKELPDGQPWSGWDKALGAGAYFADRAAA